MQLSTKILIGTHVDLNPFVNFRDAQIFPDPNLHIPERWLRDGGEGNNVSRSADGPACDVESKSEGTFSKIFC